MLERMFNYENPVWQFMNRVADLIILNIMAIIFSIPVFTIGAVWTAMYYTTVKMVRKEDTYVWKEFWSSFKANFKQATILWLIFVAILGWFGYEIVLFWNNPDLLQKPFKILIVVAFTVVTIIAMYAFPILSHFDNNNKKTVVNAFMLAILNLPRTIWLFVLLFAPFALLMDTRLWIFYVFFGISFPAFISSLSWNAIFKKYEPKNEEDEEEDDEDESSLEEENSESEESDNPIEESEILPEKDEKNEAE